MKKIITIIFIIFLSFTLTSCSHIEDTNGEDDYSLQTITEEEIVGNSYSSIKVGKFTTQNGRTIKQSVKKFSGIENIQSFKTTKGFISFTVSITVSSGNFMVVLVQEGKIIHKFLNNQENQKFTVPENTGKVSVIVAGESANYNLKLEYSN